LKRRRERDHEKIRKVSYTYTPKITYEYYVDNKRYENYVISYDLRKRQSFNLEAAANEFVKTNFPDSENIKVYYNKKKPAICNLFNDYNYISVLVSVLGSIFFLFLGYFTIFHLKELFLNS